MNTKQYYSLHAGDLKLVPYTKQYIEIYHTWMQDPEILYLTGSEPLTLEEEIDNQQSWMEDPAKYTFIILADKPIGDVNVFFHQYIEDHQAEIDVMIADKTQRGKGYASLAVKAMMSFVFEKFHKTEFIAKIKESNQASINLFQKLGFTEIKKVPAFEEIHYSKQIEEKLIDFHYI